MQAQVTHTKASTLLCAKEAAKALALNESQRGVRMQDAEVCTSCVV